MSLSKGAPAALGPRPTLASRDRVGQQVIEAERITIERLADIADAIRPQDVERKGAQASDHARLATDAAVILTETLVTDIVGAVLNPPVAPDLVRCAGDLVMREGQCGISGEGAQDVSGGLVMQVVETAPQGLPVQGNRAQAWPSSPVVQATRVATKGSLEIGWVER